MCIEGSSGSFSPAHTPYYFSFIHIARVVARMEPKRRRKRGPAVERGCPLPVNQLLQSGREFRNRDRLLEEEFHFQVREHLLELFAVDFEGGKKADACLPIDLRESSVKVKAVHLRHSYVENRDVVLTRLEALEGRLGVVEGRDLEAVSFETGLEGVGDVYFIVHEEDSLVHCCTE